MKHLPFQSVILTGQTRLRFGSVWAHARSKWFYLFTVAKTILEVLMVLQELNVIRSALLLSCLELQL